MTDEEKRDRPPSIDARKAGQVIVGNNTKQIFNWNDPFTRVLVVGSALLILIAIVISTVVLWPSPAHATLEVGAMEVADPSDINAHVSNLAVPAIPVQDITIKATPVDVTLKNNGTAPALITGIKAEIVYAEQLEECTGPAGGETRVSADFSVKFPTPVPDRPFQVKSDIRFEVKGGTVDRFDIYIGPDKMDRPVRSYLVAARLSLVHDSDESLDLGTVAIATSPAMVTSQADKSVNADCVARNAKLLDRLYAIQAVRSKDLDHLRERYGEMTYVDPSPAQLACAGDSDDSVIAKMCAKYMRKGLGVTMMLSQPPLPDRSIYVTHIDTGDPNQQYRMVVMRSQKKDLTEGWYCSGLILEGELPNLPLEECGNKSSTVDYDGHILTIVARQPLWFTYRNLKIGAEVVDRTPTREYNRIGATPESSRAEVTRGSNP